MAKPQTRYVCQSCGASTAKWAGRCESCGAWNTIVEEQAESLAPKGQSAKGGRRIEFVDLAGASSEIPRAITGIAEFDRVCGGGLVPGSAILIGGDPGIGKSTLLLQVVARLATKGSTIYISGEEAIDQVRLRARRLKVEGAQVALEIGRAHV